MFQIVASDMDGTLLGTDHRLSAYTKQTLKTLTDQGIYFAFATGRHYVDIRQIRQALAIPAFMITSNGARIHGLDNELLFSQNIVPLVADELIHIAYHHPDIETHVYTDEEWFASRECREAHQFFQESNFYYHLYSPHQLDLNHIAKVYYCSNSQEKLGQLRDTLLAHWDKKINACFSTPNCLEVMAGGVSKGEALSVVSKQLNLTLDHCIAFGDGMNDVEMLTMAGKGCIMENADQRLKDTLPKTEIIGANSHDAVANYLHQFYQLTKC